MSNRNGGLHCVLIMDCLRKIDWGGLLLLPLPWLVEELLEEEEVLVGWLVPVVGGWSSVLTLLLKVTLLLSEFDLFWLLLYCKPYCFWP